MELSTTMTKKQSAQAGTARRAAPGERAVEVNGAVLIAEIDAVLAVIPDERQINVSFRYAGTQEIIAKIVDARSKLEELRAKVAAAK